MSLKRKVAFAEQEEENEYRRARAYARLEESGDGQPDDFRSDLPAAKTKHTLDSDEEDNPDKHEKLRLDDIAGIQLLVGLVYTFSCCGFLALPLLISVSASARSRR